MNRVLIADDEPNLVWAVKHSLNDEGYEVITAYDGLEALTAAWHHHPDLIILDILMPQIDGFEVCKRLRQDPLLAAVPILFLTVRNGIEDRVTALDEGADDYLAKPFDLRELKARVRALLRRVQPAYQESLAPEEQPVQLAVLPIILDLHTSQVHVGKKTAQLTPVEFDLLHFLMTHPVQAFSSEQLLEQVWGHSWGTTDLSLVRWHIKNLRLKIEPNANHPIYIRTMSRHGYALFGDGQLNQK